MKKTVMLILGLAMLVGCSQQGTDESAAETAAPAAEPMEMVEATGQTLTGEFIWTQAEDGPVTGEITAVFTETAEGKFDVVFNFVWEDEPRTWSGTAEGSLTDGELSGKVTNEEDNFTFKGTTVGGKFTGTHQYHGEEGAEDTGTITLSS